jgi:hypothetical protein
MNHYLNKYNCFFSKKLKLDEESNLLEVIYIKEENQIGKIKCKFIIKGKIIKGETLFSLSIKLFDSNGSNIVAPKVFIDNPATCNIIGLEYLFKERKTDFILKEELSEQIFNIELKVWDLFSPAQGLTPYLWTDFSIIVQTNNNICSNTNLLISIPENILPRSTKGNYLLAYPSKNIEDRKNILIYYNNRKIILHYYMGWTEKSINPLILLMKSLLALLLLLLIGFIYSKYQDKELKYSLVTSLAAFSSFTIYFFNFIKDSNNFKIYKSTKNYFYNLFLFFGFFTIISYGIMLAYLINGVSNSFNVFQIIIIISTFIITSFILIGFLLETIGAFSTFRCDNENCHRIFYNRKNKKECIYTGRVLCYKCINNYCKKCTHFEDLLSKKTDSIENYDPTMLKCLENKKE